MEKTLSQQFSPDQKYTYSTRGTAEVRDYSKDYSAVYQKMLNGMEERKMRDAIITVGSFWYTAWVNAGKPDLGDLKDQPITQEEQQELESMDKSWRDGKII